MARKPVLIFKLTPAQISLVDRLAKNDGRLVMDSLCLREIVAYQELQKLGFVDLQAGQRQKLWVLLTAEGENVRSAGYFSKRAVLRMTEPQINLLRFLADTDDVSIGRHSSEIPDTMLDVCRRMALRGWVERQEHARGGYWAKLTFAGKEILSALNAIHQQH